MRGKIIAALAATLLTITAGVLAQTSGFPSRPRFQTVTVAQGTGSGYNPVVLCANGEASNSRCYTIRIGSAADLQIATADDNGATVNTILSATRSGTTVSTVNLTGTSVQANGSAIATGKIVACYVLSDGTLQSQCYGVSSATNTGTGLYTVNFSTAFATAPACVVSALQPNIANPTSTSTTQLFVSTQVAATNAASNSHFTLMCYAA